LPRGTDETAMGTPSRRHQPERSAYRGGAQLTWKSTIFEVDHTALAVRSSRQAVGALPRKPQMSWFHDGLPALV
jgi:hypothetical protein